MISFVLLGSPNAPTFANHPINRIIQYLEVPILKNIVLITQVGVSGN